MLRIVHVHVSRQVFFWALQFLYSTMKFKMGSNFSGMYLKWITVVFVRDHKTVLHTIITDIIVYIYNFLLWFIFYFTLKFKNFILIVCKYQFIDFFSENYFRYFFRFIEKECVCSIWIVIQACSFMRRIHIGWSNWCDIVIVSVYMLQNFLQLISSVKLNWYLVSGECVSPPLHRDVYHLE